MAISCNLFVNLTNLFPPVCFEAEEQRILGRVVFVDGIGTGALKKYNVKQMCMNRKMNNTLLKMLAVSTSLHLVRSS